LRGHARRVNLRHVDLVLRQHFELRLAGRAVFPLLLWLVVGEVFHLERTYTEQEFLAQFPFGEKAAQPLPVIRKKAVSNLCISDAKFSAERFNLMTAGKITKVTLPNGEDRYFR